MVCDKVVCERWCVTKLCVCQGGGGEGGGRGGGGAGYRIKNKNPTQRCGELWIGQVRSSFHLLNEEPNISEAIGLFYWR